MSLFYVFRAFKCPSLGENYRIYATLFFVTPYGWRLACRPDTTHAEWQKTVSHRYSNFLLMMSTWMPEIC